MRKQKNTLSPSPKGSQSPKFFDSDFREVRGLGLGRPKSSGILQADFQILLSARLRNKDRPVQAAAVLNV
jgi:hypothetical protein